MAWLRARVEAVAPDLPMDYLKVTGSNGKGSTCAMVSAMLKALGVRAGRNISPHLFRFNERITIDGAPISDGDCASGFAWVQAAVQAWQQQHGAGSFGAFEIFTGMALYHFARNGVAHGVFEAGIGGRYDAVRMMPGSLCVLTSLDLEHTQLLGDSLELIAYDKLDLCPPGGTLVLFPLGDHDLLRRIRHYARLKQIQLFETAVRCRVTHRVTHPTETTFNAEIDGMVLEDLRLPLLGAHQVDNAMVAASAVTLYVNRLFPHLSQDDLKQGIRDGLARVNWPGRATFLPGPPPVIYDVGHTPAAIQTFCATLQPMVAGRRVVLVIGVSHNKAVEEIVTALVAVADRVICTRAHHLGAPVDRIEAAVAAARPQLPRERFETVEDAVTRAVAIARAEDMTLVFAGGLFLAVEAVVAYQGDDPRALRFF
nr:cyanophycin synthetase [Acanthopleuribacter pedis]